MPDPASADSGEVTKMVFNGAFDEELPACAWFEKPGQNLRLRRFGSAMQDVAALQPAGSILQGRLHFCTGGSFNRLFAST
jgi:hypothetical protein